MATYYWVGGDGTWDASSTTNWSASSGGAGGAGAPNSTDTVIFDSASGTGTCTTAAGSACAIATLNSSTLGLTLGANHTMSGGFSLTLGALSLGSYTLTCFNLSSSNANTRNIDFGTGEINVTGNGTFVWTTQNSTGFSYTGTPKINLTYSGSTGTRSIGMVTAGTEANALNFNVSAGSDSFTTTSGTVVKNLNFTGFSGTWASTVTTNFYGNLTLSSGMATSAGTSAIQFLATSGTQQVATNGVTINCPITQNSPGATLQLQDNLTLGSTRRFLFTAGVLDLTGNSGNWQLTCGDFSSSNTNTRSVIFGTGRINCAATNATILNLSTFTGFSYAGSGDFYFTDNSLTGTRFAQIGNVAGTPTQATAPNVYVTAGSDSVGVFNFVGTLNLTGFTGTLGNTQRTIFGNFVLGTGMTTTAGTLASVLGATSGTQNITGNCVTFNIPLTSNGLGGTRRITDNVTLASTISFVHSGGILDLNGQTLSTGIFSGSTSAVRSIAFNAGKISVTGNAGVVVNLADMTNFSYTGAPTIELTYAGGVGTRTFQTGTILPTEAKAVDCNVTAGSDTVAFVGIAKSINLTGFSGTIANNAITVYGSLTASSGTTFTAGANAITFASTVAGNTITSAGKTMDFPVTFNGVGGVWACQDALTQGSTRAFTITNGTVQLKNGVTSTVGSFVANNTAVKFLQSTTPGSQATLSQASGTVNVADLTIRDINAVGGASWNAYTDFENTDAGNNDGWNFSLSPPYSTAELPITLRPFTQPRRF